jgi:excisionase family DNA binding protein
MQVEIPDELIDALRDSLMPLVERLIDERVEQRRPLLLSVSQVAEELGCSRSSVYGLIHGGHLEAIQVGRIYRVASATLVQYVEELGKPRYERSVVTGARSSGANQSTRSGVRGVPPRSGTVATPIPATRAPRSPRPRKSKLSKQELAESRWTREQLADRWWGLESANALLGRSGVA